MVEKRPLNSNLRRRHSTRDSKESSNANIDGGGIAALQQIARRRRQRFVHRRRRHTSSSVQANCIAWRQSLVELVAAAATVVGMFPSASTLLGVLVVAVVEQCRALAVGRVSRTS